MKRLLILFALLAVLPLAAAAQPRTVTGRITNNEGNPLPGAAVLVKGTNSGTNADAQGLYTIAVPDSKATLVFSFIGYESQEIVVGKQTTINVVMQSTQMILEEVVVAGSASFVDFSPNYHIVRYDNAQAEEYAHNKENRFLSVAKAPLSTFSLDVDAASYSNMRRMINDGELPPADAIRTEELVNYFSYDYAQPTGSDPVRLNTEVGTCPWNPRHRLVRIGVKAREVESSKLPLSNFVFLIDVSGSMYGASRLGLVKASLKLLVNNLRPDDKVSIVVYAGSDRVALPTTSGSDKQKIRSAIDELEAGGSTAGGAGIKRAYQIARENFVKGGNNRIILCTDGDFNVGVSSTAELESLVEQERKSGVFLTVLGYGMGNYKDAKLQTLAEKGNGNHAYIDNMQEANRVLVSEFGGTMHAVAKDVKLQVEFNPLKVQAYRLIGYESRLLADEDFNDDTKDAGELGVGHTVTAFYEVIPVGVSSRFAPSVDPLKYQAGSSSVTADSGSLGSVSDELLTVKLRYKQPNGDTSKLMSLPVRDNGTSNNSADFRFAAAVALFGQLLSGSDFVEFRGKEGYDTVIALARTALGNDPHGYRREFIRLVESARGLKVLRE